MRTKNEDKVKIDCFYRSRHEEHYAPKIYLKIYHFYSKSLCRALRSLTLVLCMGKQTYTFWCMRMFYRDDAPTARGEDMFLQAHSSGHASLSEVSHAADSP